MRVSRVKKGEHMNNKKLIIIISVVVVVVAAGLFALKTFLFKPKKNNGFLHLNNAAVSRPIINNSPAFKSFAKKTTLSKTAVPTVKTFNKQSNSADNKAAAQSKAITANNNKAAGQNKALAISEMSAGAPKKIKYMLKLNAEINKLNEEAKVAQLKQEIKNLNKIPGGVGGVGGVNNAAASSISLVAISKGAAIVNFGKKNVAMRVGMSYGGYKCLLISSTGIALEKNNKVINLSLSI
jgi:hypothetical protein